MQKKSQEDYRTAVAGTLIDQRSDIKTHTDELSDHQDTLDSILTRLAAVEALAANAHTDAGNAYTLAADAHADAGKAISALTNFNVYAGASVSSGSYTWLFVIGTNRSMYWRFWNGSWSGWINIGGWWKSGPWCYISPGSNTCYVFAQGSDGIYYNGNPSGGAWSGWTKWTGDIADLGQGAID